MQERQSNIELLRIISMLMVFLVHTNYFSLGAPVKEDVLISPLTTFWRIFTEQICIVGVNVFIIISGWFGIKPSLKRFCSLLFQVFFWGGVILLLGWALGLDIPLKSTAQVFWFGGFYWFILSYIGLYVLSPILNTFIETASPRLYLTVIVCFFALEFVYGWFLYSHSFYFGHTILSFAGLYLLSRFIRLYSAKLKSTKPSFDFLCFITLTILPAIISFCGIASVGNLLNMIYYSSPFVIGAATFLFLCFSKLSIHNKTINKISFSTLSVYLIHQHPIFIPHFKTAMRSLFACLNPFFYTGIVVIIAICFLLLCVSLDQIRIQSWKGICSLFLDKLIGKVEASFNGMLDKLGYKA